MLQTFEKYRIEKSYFLQLLKRFHYLFMVRLHFFKKRENRFKLLKRIVLKSNPPTAATAFVMPGTRVGIRTMYPYTVMDKPSSELKFLPNAMIEPLANLK